MAKQRLITSDASVPEEESAILSLRPQRMAEYIGQKRLIEKLTIALQAVRQRGEPMEHILFHGPPGLGKTTLSHVIANELGSHLMVTAGPALTRGSDLVGTLTKLQKNDVLFIDEIHRLPIALEEHLYSAMEDFKVEFVVDSGLHAKTITLPLQPFTLIGATTRAGLLSGPMRSRFGISGHLEFYDRNDLLAILRRSAGLLGLTDVPEKALLSIADRSRGTPRIANRLLRRVRDYSQIRCAGRLDEKSVDEALALEGVDRLGLDDLDRQYMKSIGDVYGGGPVGLEAVAATLNEDSGTLEDMVEPYLLQLGFLARTRRGRRLTAKAAEYLGLKLRAGWDQDAEGDLFDPSEA